MAFGLAARFALAALGKIAGFGAKTAVTLTPLALGDELLNDGGMRKAVTDRGVKAVTDPFGTAAAIGNEWDRKKKAADEVRAAWGKTKRLATGDGETWREVGAQARNAAENLTAEAKDKAQDLLARAKGEAPPPSTDSQDGPDWGKRFGWIGAFLGSGWLAKTLFFGGNKDEKAEDKPNWFMRFAVVGALVGAVAYAINRFTSKNDFEQAAAWDPNALSTATPTRTSFVHGAPLIPENVAFVLPAAVPQTPVAREFAQANSVIETAKAGSNDPAMTARAAIQRAQVRSAGTAAAPEAGVTEHETLDHS